MKSQVELREDRIQDAWRFGSEGEREESMGMEGKGVSSLLDVHLELRKNGDNIFDMLE